MLFVGLEYFNTKRFVHKNPSFQQEHFFTDYSICLTFEKISHMNDEKFDQPQTESRKHS